MSDYDDLPEEISRSQERRDALDILRLAHDLVALPVARIAKLELSEDLLYEVHKSQRITQHVAHKRQVQFLAKQMRKREDELEVIRQALTENEELKRQQTAGLHRIEALRLKLIDGDDNDLAELLKQFPDTDRQHLRNLIRQAKADRDNPQAVAASRAVFKILRELIEAESSDQAPDTAP